MVVLMAVRDEAKGSLSSSRRDRIQSVLGAQKLDSLLFRGGYALVAVKGDAILDEQCATGTSELVTATGLHIIEDILPNSHKFRVTSGRSGGSVVPPEFYLDDEKLPCMAARGMNVAIISGDGRLEKCYTFDTHKNTSEAQGLVDLIEATPTGTVMMLAVRDDGRASLFSPAQEAIKEKLGGVKIVNLTYRGAYALVGVKDGIAVSEEVLGSGSDDLATASGSHAIVILTTTTTTTTAPPCSLYICPTGLTLKPGIWSLSGADENRCCTNATGEIISDIGVQSAGFQDGNAAVFFANGKVIYTAPGRGLTVLTLRADGTRETSETFDTMRSGSDDLAAYLNELPNGTLVLIGARDEASGNLSQAAKLAIKGCGARLIDSLSFRGSYALVGIKGGAAKAEMAKSRTEGWSVAVSQIEIVISVNADLPVCQARSPKPPLSGYVSDGNLNLEAQCRYRLWEADAATECLSSSWIVITGSSNTLLEFGNLVNMLAPDEYNIEREGERIGASAVTDVVIEDGKVTYWAVVSNRLEVCRQVDKAIAQQNDPACRAVITEHLAKAPAHGSGKIRITMFISFFWDRTSLALDAVSNDPAWKDAKVAVVTQVGAWYNVCSVTKEDYCPRKELLAMDRDPAIQVFKAEMEAVFVEMDSFCTNGGRAAKLGCNVQTISWTNGKRDNENFKVMNAYIEEAMSTRKSESFRIMDFFALGGAMPEEVVNGHGSQMLKIWAWQVMLGGMCDPKLASSTDGRTYASWEGNLCSGTEAREENCPIYWAANCPEKPGGRCEKWECMNSVPCTFQAVTPPAQGDITGRCTDEINHTVTLLPEQQGGKQDHCHTAGGRRIRVWCQQDAQWVLPFLAVLLAAGVAAVQFLWQKYAAKPAKTKAPEKSGGSEPVTNEEIRRPVVRLPTRPQMPVQGVKSLTSAGTEPRSPAADSIAMKSDEAMTIVENEEINVNENDNGSSPAEPRLMDVTSATPVAPAAAVICSKPAEPMDVTSATPATPATAVIVHQAETTLAAGAAQQTTQAKSKFRPAGNKYPLGLARFIGSLHVVVGHINAKEVVEDSWYLYNWGFTWVPWFFMLSGFVLFSAYLRNPKQETMIQYVMRRSNTIYPLYAISLIPSFFLAKTMGTLQASWDTLVAQSFLMQAWWPGWTESALQMHCWFLSCMVVYWFFFKPLAWCLKGLNLLKTCLLMAFCFFLPWIVLIVPALAGERLDWYTDHQPLKTDTALDFGVVMIKFHPICYFHVFVVGMLLAKLRQHLDKIATAAGPANSWRNPWLVAIQFIAPLGYLMLLLVFNVPGFRPKLWGFKLSTRLSVLLPFQAMVLFGLAGLPSLPLPFFSLLFSKFDFLENYSFAVYVFQFLDYSIWPQTHGIDLLWFIIFVVAIAVVIARCIQQPAQRWWGSHPKARLLVPFVLAICFVCFDQLPDPTNPEVPLTDIPAFVSIGNGMVDMRLGLRDPSGDAQGAVIINPSILVQGDEVVVVARRHRIETERYVGNRGDSTASFIDQIWHSDIAMGKLPLDVVAWGQWPASLRTHTDNPLWGMDLEKWTGLRTETGGQWAELCTKETYIEKNNTVIRHMVTGPEDPKAVIGESGKLVLVFDSVPPSGGNWSSCRTKDGFGDAVTQMYMASDVKSTQPNDLATGYKLNYGATDVPEKNWIPFTYQNSIHFVYSPLPHVILAADLTGSADKIGSSTFGPLQKLASSNQAIQIRGSAQAVLVEDFSKTPNLPRVHYLALLHSYNKATGRYSHFAYRFGAEPPFMMLQVSEQLPLTEAESKPGGVPFAFASGLAVHNQTVVISYGAGDRDARALVMTLSALDGMFNCSTFG